MSLNPFKSMQKDMEKAIEKAEKDKGEVDKESLKIFSNITKYAAIIMVAGVILAIAFPLVTYFLFTHM